MPRLNTYETSEHDLLVLMMAQYFKRLGYTNVKADIPGWVRPDPIYWTNKPDQKYFPDVTCVDLSGGTIILEAETCSTFTDQHTREQFEIFRAHADNVRGRFEVVVPRACPGGEDARTSITRISSTWGIRLDNVWTPSS